MIKRIAFSLLLTSSAATASGAVTLHAEPETARVLSSQSQVWTLAPNAELSGEAFLAVTLSAPGAGAMEAQLVYEGEYPLTLSRRSLDSANLTHTIHWQVLQSESVTSATLALRAPSGTSTVVENVQILPPAAVSLRDRIIGTVPHPLRLTSAARPVSEGMLDIEVVVPAPLLAEVNSTTLNVELSADGSSIAKEMVVFALPELNNPTATKRFSLRIPATTKDLEARLTLEDELVYTLSIDSAPLRAPFFEAPDNSSVESFFALERNGELVIYSVIGEEGEVRTQPGLPVIGNVVWLTVGDGIHWYLNEPVLRSSPNVDWLAGGPLDFSIGTIDRNIYAFFTTAGMDGSESLSVATSRDSLRVTPIIQNPVYTPEGDLPPLWRGNAFFEMNGGKLLVGIERADGKSRAKALISDLPSRWIDLGDLPLPELPEDALQLSSFEQDGTYYLLSGPTAVLWRSEHPLRGWSRVEFKAPKGWEALRLVRWMDRAWLFGIVRQNGRGIVTWAPALLDDTGLRVDLDAPFTPQEIHPLDATQPPPPRPETYVR